MRSASNGWLAMCRPKNSFADSLTFGKSALLVTMPTEVTVSLIGISHTHALGIAST